MKIFRIIDFFELLQTLRTKKLRVPSAARFSDPNELIGNLFSVLQNPMFAPLTNDAVKQLVCDQKSLVQSHYVSCWTRMKDSVAMWEIYSPTRTSAQMEVDDEYLKLIFDAFYESRSFAHAYETPPNCNETFFYPPSVDNCRYENLLELSEGLKEKTRSNQIKTTEALQEHGIEVFKEKYDKVVADASQQAVGLFNTKDRAYEYENEVRFSLRASRRNNRPYDECKKDPFFVLFDSHLRPSNTEEAGENIFVDFQISVIQHVWLDGRAPDWLIDLQQQLLKELGVDSTKSSTYGAFVDLHSIEKWWD